MGNNIDKNVDHMMKNHHATILRNVRKKKAEETSNERQEEIEKIIIFYTYTKGGIKHSELTSLMGLDRRSLDRYIKKLIKSKKVQRKGKRGHYSSTTVDTSNFYFSSIALQNIFTAINKVNRVGNESIGTKDYYHTPFHDNSLEKWLFELSNKIGAFLLFLFIECMNPNNLYTTAGKYDDLLSDDLLSMRWVRNSFTPLIDKLLHEFREFYFQTMLNHHEHTEDFIEMGLYALECEDCNYYEEHYSKKKLWENQFTHAPKHHKKWYKIKSHGIKEATNEPTVRELYEAENCDDIGPNFSHTEHEYENMVLVEIPDSDIKNKELDRGKYSRFEISILTEVLRRYTALAFDERHDINKILIYGWIDRTTSKVTAACVRRDFEF